jgi:hypothetical protein
VNRYSIKDVIKILNELDDYDRTENDDEQNAIKIAKYILKQLDNDKCFKVEIGKIEEIN